ncbi:hypothetical protein FEM48_Zijuj01G0310700 [Ziziphus jujuba var. spinosa]|uniref:Uncharacterized protein n=1 Tax=Ziziphus jujuba var. spinosa TaxID=714518 RepID=A0A978W661_ZIZJJ|nr:hypothetical protein FEM48_Zijuj01G0310700 [Ziziphus jujuba var. spinosa]
MSSIQLTLSSKSTSNFDERQWVIHIRRTLEEELEDDGEVPVCIFNVPKILMANDPDSYTPQQLAIGPYHCWSPELYEMERYKISAAKITQKNLHGVTFETLVEQLTKLEERIRACYHNVLDFNGETLAWMMAIDASFLLEFLQVYAIKEGKSISRLSSRMSHLVDHAGRKSAHNAILRHMVMLENQIPLFVLRKVLEFQFSSLEAADDILFSMLMGFCKELSPFKMVEDMPKLSVTGCAHLLDFLYKMITHNVEEPSDQIIEVDEYQSEATTGEEKSSLDDSKYVKQLLREVWKLLSKLNVRPIRLIKKALVSKPLTVIIKLPWTILSTLPGFRILKQPVEIFSSIRDKEEIKPEDENSSSNNIISRPPLVEEITIPSVTELSKSGVQFVATNCCISSSSVSFDAKTVTFCLPTISLDLNTKVILRNLVAYEASNATGPLVFTRYTELMNGIIDTEEDVKLLREKGIIWNHLKSDKDVANLWNGMSRSIRLTKVPFLDKVIEGVNKYHNGRWKVKFGTIMKLYVFGSWQLLTLLAAVLLLLLMGLEAFCSVYGCSRIFDISPTQ